MKSLTQFFLIVTILFVATVLSAQGDDAAATLLRTEVQVVLNNSTC